MAGSLSALILLALILGLGRYAESIPLAVLAGILMKVGWDIIDWRFITRAHRVKREYLVVMLITFSLTVFLDLVTAVAIGLIAAGHGGARQFERLEMDHVISTPLLDQHFLYQGNMDVGDEFSARMGLVSLQGTFTVASSNRLVNALSIDIREHEGVILDFTATVLMDDSAALVVERLIDLQSESGTFYIILGLRGAAAATLRSLNVWPMFLKTTSCLTWKAPGNWQFAFWTGNSRAKAPSPPFTLSMSKGENPPFPLPGSLFPRRRPRPQMSF